MAYRQPERRETPAPPQSFLDEFLENVDPLPNTIRSLFQEIRTLDDKIHTTVTESSVAATEAIQRSTTKGAPSENLKRTLHEFVHLQASATEYAERKQKLARDARDLVREKLDEIDKRMEDFEKQLRKEGRWPREGGEEPVKTPRAKAPAHLVERKERNVEKAVKGRRMVQPTTPRAAALAARAEEKVKKKEEEEAVVDESQILYCKCRKVSHGDMVACEGKKCKYEWFHFACVGLTSEPKGSWYCDACSASMGLKRKSAGGRKK